MLQAVDERICVEKADIVNLKFRQIHSSSNFHLLCSNPYIKCKTYVAKFQSYAVNPIHSVCHEVLHVPSPFENVVLFRNSFLRWNDIYSLPQGGGGTVSSKLPEIGLFDVSGGRCVQNFAPELLWHHYFGKSVGCTH